MRSALVSMLLTLGCQPSQRPDSPSPADSGDPGDSLPADSSTQPDDSDAAEDTGDTGEPQEPPWGDGPLSVRGQVYFFDMETPGVIDWIQDVEGAEVYLLQAPELRVTVHPDSDHAFEIGGIPEGVEITLAAVHPDYFPHLSATLTTGSEDLEGVTFQAVSHGIAFLAALLGWGVAALRRPERRPAAFGLLWFVIALAPTSFVVRVPLAPAGEANSIQLSPVISSRRVKITWYQASRLSSMRLGFSGSMMRSST